VRFVTEENLPFGLPNCFPSLFFLALAFEYPNLYILPIWWNTLSEAKREEYKQILLNVGREHAELV
jgi:hypothetical protein